MYHVVIWKIWIQIHYDYFTCQLRNSSKNSNCCCTWKEQNPTLHTPLVNGHHTDSLDTGKSEVMEKKCHVKPNMRKATSLLDILLQYLYLYLYMNLVYRTKVLILIREIDEVLMQDPLLGISVSKSIPICLYLHMHICLQI